MNKEFQNTCCYIGMKRHCGKPIYKDDLCLNHYIEVMTGEVDDLMHEYTYALNALLLAK